MTKKSDEHALMKACYMPRKSYKAKYHDAMHGLTEDEFCEKAGR